MRVDIVATNNPYQTPESKVAISSEISLEKFSYLAAGQKIIIVAILLYFLGTLVFFSINRQIGSLVLLIAFVIGLMGFVKAVNGVEFKTSSKLLYGISMLIPVLNVLVLAHLGELVNRELKAAGYKIGLFGVKGNYTA